MMRSELLKHTQVESFQLGKLQITAFATEHDKAAISYLNQDEQLSHLIESHDAVLLEYFPYEFATFLQEYPILQIGNYKYTIEYFDLLSKLIHAKNKPVWLADPAYGLAHVKLRQQLMSSTLFRTLGMYAISGATIPVIERLQKNETSAPSPYRRFLLKGAIATTVGAFLGATINTSMFSLLAGEIPDQEKAEVWLKYERYIRRVITSRNIQHIEKMEARSLSILMIYPAAHIEQIKSFCSNKLDLEAQLQHVMKIIKLVNVNSDDFFIFRKYHPLSVSDSIKWSSNRITVPRLPNSFLPD